ncbi:MAG: hypothetical protein ACLQBL_12185 [Polyangiaceae bacterium]
MILAKVTDGRKTFVLPHDSYCTARGRCACIPALRLGTKRPSVLSLAEQQELLVAHAVLSVPEIARAIRLGRLRIGGRT